MKKKIMMVLVTIMVTSMLVGCGKSEKKDTLEVKTITMAMVSAWNNLIPFDNTITHTDAVLDLMYEKLVYLKADGTYKPRLAESFEMNEDNTVLTFKIRKDAKWHDGTPVTAHDVVFTSLLYSAPTIAGARANQFNIFKGFGEGDDTLEVYAVDDYTVKFNCIEPTNMDFMIFTKFRDVYILPKHILGDIPLTEIRSHAYWQNPVGSGSAIYKSQISGERIEFLANKDYYQGAPDWDRFTVRIVTTAGLLAGLINGEIDLLAGDSSSLQLSDWDMAQQDSNLVSTSVETLGFQFMAINVSKEYMTLQVREAINYAVDRRLIVDKLLKGEGSASYSPVSQGSIYYNDEVEIKRDVDKAKELLKLANWDESIELVMSVPTGNTIREQAAVIIQQNLNEVGIKARIESSDFSTHLNKVREGNFDLGFVGSSGSPDPSGIVIDFNPDHLNNFSHLEDWSIFNAGVRGQNVFSFEDRKVAYDEYQRLLREQLPYIFLYSQNSLFVQRSDITGVTDIQDFTQLNRDIWNWKKK